MNSQASLDFAHARRNDPETSHKAAAKVVNLGRTRDAILGILKYHGPQTDEQIAKWYANGRAYVPSDHPKASPSGLRSRRSELVKLDLVECCGIGKTASGRDCQIWRVRQ